ncbi:hypothetical protein M0R45_030684 [Rubus argutus]|uniref:Uncharacterized protein n=1 Tax=Rubus argutus TaxID=59490 RepID=A0AAW1WBU5_RUBAR
MIGRISSQRASHARGTNLVRRDKQEDSHDVQMGTSLELIRNELHEMKTMMEKQMQMLTKEVRIIKSRLPARKSGTLTRCGRKRRQESVAGEKKNGKGDGGGEGSLSNRTHIGCDENYGWDIDDHDMYQHKNFEVKTIVGKRDPAIQCDNARGDMVENKAINVNGNEQGSKKKCVEKMAGSGSCG